MLSSRANNNHIIVTSMMQTEQEIVADSTSLGWDVSSHEDTAVFPPVNQRHLAWQDLRDGLVQWPIWLMLAYQDIQLRYRRSILGPFWLTISMGITVYTMGFLYAHLFHTDMQQYYPFLVAGMLTWALISSAITDLTDTFTMAEGLIKQIKLPYSLYIHRVVARNMLIFFHNFLVMIPIYLLFYHGAKINAHSLLIVPGILILYVNAFIYGLILAMIGARYRDISQIIKSLIQVIFFMTPIMWSPSILPENSQYLVNLNPVYAFIEMIRCPLLGDAPSLLSIAIVLLSTIAGAAVCLNMFSRYRARIIYWI